MGVESISTRLSGETDVAVYLGGKFGGTPGVIVNAIAGSVVVLFGLFYLAANPD